jgi:hypothetical protein
MYNRECVLIAAYDVREQRHSRQYNPYKRHSTLLRTHHACENSAYDYNTAPRRSSSGITFSVPRQSSLELNEDPWTLQRKY